MKIIQLKWSDEAGWKDFVVVSRFGLSDEAALLAAEADWRANRLKHGLKYDCQFRIVDVLLGGAHHCELSTNPLSKR